MADTMTWSPKIDTALSMFVATSEEPNSSLGFSESDRLSHLQSALPPWAKEAHEQVSRSIIADRLPHALTVQGDNGIGIEMLAGAIASARLCEQVSRQVSAPNPDETAPVLACGRCKSCELLAAGTHPDIKVLEPTGAANLIKVDQVRELIGFMAQTPQISQWKLCWIGDAHRMNQNAANALLKVLEEPQGESLLLLVTDRPQILLPTIRSRSRSLQVRPPSEPETLRYCEEKGVAEGHIQQLLPVLGQRPHDIVAWAESDKLSAWQQLDEGLQQVSRGELSTQALTDVLKDLPVETILDWLISGVGRRVKAALLLEQSDGQSGIDPESVKRWYSYYDWLIEMHRDVERGSNPNRQLLLDESFLRWRAVSQSVLRSV